MVDFNDYSFGESEPFSRPAPAYAPVEPQHSAPKFHRFKDDVLIQQQLQARAEGKTFAPQPVPEQKDLIIDASGVLEVDPQALVSSVRRIIIICLARRCIRLAISDSQPRVEDGRRGGIAKLKSPAKEKSTSLW